jgi:hypothetical protein
MTRCTKTAYEIGEAPGKIASVQVPLPRPAAPEWAVSKNARHHLAACALHTMQGTCSKMHSVRGEFDQASTAAHDATMGRS